MDKKRYVWVLLTMAFLIVLSCSGCTLHPESSFDRSGVAMDTTVSLRASGKEAKKQSTKVSTAWISWINWPDRMKTAM